MSILCRESVSEKRERVIRELVEGRECATKLKHLLQKPVRAEGYVSAEALLAEVQRSFTETLSLLTSSEGDGGGGDEVAAASSNIDLRSEGSSESRKRSSPPLKDRRGSYRRRKTEHTWTNVSQNIEDNHAWRKYGQKEILNSKFPRNYFRCTRKFDQGCRATKQVQRMEENPDMYQITYIGLHTCKGALKVPQMATCPDTWDSFVNSLPDDSKVPKEQDHSPTSISSQTPTLVKQEYPKADTQSDVTDNLDPSLWSDLKDFELSKSSIAPIIKMASSDNADAVYSCTGSHCLDMDFGAFPSHFCTDFHFGHEGHLL